MESHEGTLVIVVLKAKDLIDNHSFYKQDVYASITLNGTTKKTHVDVKGGQHPVWDAEVRIPIKKGEKDILEVKCWSKERKEDECLGTGKIDIGETLKTGEFDDWINLAQEDKEREQRGSVYLEMTFYSSKPAPAPAPAPTIKPTPAAAKPSSAPIPIPKYLLPSNGAPLQRRASKLSPQDRLWRPPATSRSPKDMNDALPPIPQAESRHPVVAASSKATESAPLPSILRAGPAGGAPPARSRLVSQPAHPGQGLPNPYGPAPEHQRRASGSPPRGYPPSIYNQQPQPGGGYPISPGPSYSAGGPQQYGGPQQQQPLSRGHGSYLPPQQQQQQPLQSHNSYMASPPQQQQQPPPQHTSPPHIRHHSSSYSAPAFQPNGGASPPSATPSFSFPEPSHTPAPPQSYQPPNTPGPTQSYPQSHTPVPPQAYSGPSNQPGYQQDHRHRSPAPPPTPRHDSAPLQDPYLSARYSTPLPLPPGSKRESPKLPGSFPSGPSSPPKHSPPKFHVSTSPPQRSLSPPAAVQASSPPARERTPMIDERRLRELREAEDRAKRAREQELKDAELAHQMLLDEEAAEEKRKAEAARVRKEQELETARKLEQDRKIAEHRKQMEERRRQEEKEEEDRLRKEQEEEERRFKEQEENDMEMARRLDRELNEGALL